MSTKKSHKKIMRLAVVFGLVFASLFFQAGEVSALRLPVTNQAVAYYSNALGTVIATNKSVNVSTEVIDFYLLPTLSTNLGIPPGDTNYCTVKITNIGSLTDMYILKATNLSGYNTIVYDSITNTTISTSANVNVDNNYKFVASTVIPGIVTSVTYSTTIITVESVGYAGPSGSFIMISTNIIKITPNSNVHLVYQNKWYVTITNALVDATNGDLIEVYPGTYNEEVLIANFTNLTIRAWDWTNSGNNTTTIIDGSGFNNAVSIDNSSGVEISGFSIKNAAEYGVYSARSSDAGIRNNLIFSNSIAGISITNSAESMISNNTVNNSTNGIIISQSTATNYIIANNINNMMNNAVLLAGTENVFLDNNELYNNDTGINVNNSDNNYIMDNNVTNNTYGIKLLSGSVSNVITNNFIANHSYSGIQLDGANYNSILNNNISFNSNGIEFVNVAGTMDNLISFNRITWNTNGIYYSSTGNNNIVLNTISSNEVGVNMWWVGGSIITLNKNNLNDNSLANVINDIGNPTILLTNWFGTTIASNIDKTIFDDEEGYMGITFVPYRLFGKFDITPGADTYTPPAVTSFTGNTVSGTNVVLSWSPSSSAVRYFIYRNNVDSWSNFTKGTVVGITTGTNWTNFGPAEGTWYYYVTALDDASYTNESWYSTAALVYVDRTVPYFTNISPTNNQINVATNANISFNIFNNVAVISQSIIVKIDGTTLLSNGVFVLSSGSITASNTGWNVNLNPNSSFAENTNVNVYIFGRDSALKTNSLTWQFTTVDLAPPSFANISPTNNQIKVATNANISFDILDNVAVASQSIIVRIDGTTALSNGAFLTNCSGSITASGTGWSVVVDPAGPFGEWTNVNVYLYGEDTTGNTNSLSFVFSTTDYTAPAPFALLLPADNTITNTNSIGFTWAPSSDTGSGLTNYTLMITNKDALWSTNLSVSAVNQTVNNLQEGTNYWYVVAQDRVGNIRRSNTTNMFVIDMTGPGVVNLTAPINGFITNSSVLDFTWTQASDNYSGVTNYEVQISTNTNFTGIWSNITIPTLNYKFTNLNLGTNWWRVRAIDKLGNIGQWSKTNTFKILPPPPDAPAILTNIVAGTNEIDLVWENVSNETTYTLFRNTSNDSSSATQVTNTAVNVTNFNDTNLATYTWYYYWVKAYNTGGGSDFSAVASNRTWPPLPAVPAILSIDTISTNEIDLVWENVAYETNYTLFRSMTNDTNTAIAVINKVTNVTNHNDMGLTTNTWYYYWIRAYNITGESAYSAVASNKTWARDFIAPYITNLSPTNNQRNVATNANIVFNFFDNGRVLKQSILVRIDGITALSNSTFQPGYSGSMTASNVSTATGWNVVVNPAVPFVEWTNVNVYIYGEDEIWGNTNSLSFVFSTTDYTAPGVVTNLMPADNKVTNTNTIEFSWNPSVDNRSGISNYNLKLTNSTTGWYTNIISMQTVYTVTSLTDGTYYWAVQAEDAAGNSSTWSTPNILVVDTIRPIKVDLISPTYNEIVNSTKVDFIWKSLSETGSGISNYVIQISTNNFISTNTNAIILGENNTNYTILDLTFGTNWWRVQAKDRAGNTSIWTTSRFVIKPVLAKFILSHSPSYDTSVWGDFVITAIATNYLGTEFTNQDYTGTVTLTSIGSKSNTVKWTNLKGNGTLNNIGPGTNTYTFDILDAGVVTLSVWDDNDEKVFITNWDGNVKTNTTLLFQRLDPFIVSITPAPMGIASKGYATVDELNGLTITFSRIMDVNSLTNIEFQNNNFSNIITGMTLTTNSNVLGNPGTEVHITLPLNSDDYLKDYHLWISTNIISISNYNLISNPTNSIYNINMGFAYYVNYKSLVSKPNGGFVPSINNRFSLTIPPDELPDDAYIDIDDTLSPSSSSKIAKANSLRKTHLMKVLPEDTYYEITAHDRSEVYFTSLNGGKVTISNYYTDDDDDGYVDGTAIPESKLKLFILNESTGKWEVVEGSTNVDLVNNIVYAEVDEFGIYCIMGYYGSEDFETSCYSYPNPADINKYKVTIEFNLDRNAKISVHIYTILGELVKNLAEDELYLPGLEYKKYWDGTNDIGLTVVNGVYLIKVEMKPEDSSKPYRKILKQAIIK